VVAASSGRRRWRCQGSYPLPAASAWLLVCCWEAVLAQGPGTAALGGHNKSPESLHLQPATILLAQRMCHPVHPPHAHDMRQRQPCQYTSNTAARAVVIRVPFRSQHSILLLGVCHSAHATVLFCWPSKGAHGLILPISTCALPAAIVACTLLRAGLQHRICHSTARALQQRSCSSDHAEEVCWAIRDCWAIYAQLTCKRRARILSCGNLISTALTSGRAAA